MRPAGVSAARTARLMKARSAQLVPLGKQGDGAAVVGPQRLLEGRQREALRLRVRVFRVAARARRPGHPADHQRFTRHADG
jgi:hypothetical protein